MKEYFKLWITTTKSIWVRRCRENCGSTIELEDALLAAFKAGWRACNDDIGARS